FEYAAPENIRLSMLDLYLISAAWEQMLADIEATQTTGIPANTISLAAYSQPEPCSAYNEWLGPVKGDINKFLVERGAKSLLLKAIQYRIGEPGLFSPEDAQTMTRYLVRAMSADKTANKLVSLRNIYSDSIIASIK